MMNRTINTYAELNSERLVQMLDEKQCLDLLYPYKIKKCRLECLEIGFVCQ